ncbi:DUF2508 family protein [Dysosmobacter sp.]|uniref:DUF2508 family protein n=1 Tax=Dysosmobacter sp. TaxID=2591382 RepID=UPI002A947274|nr:DUF2508 family protein [Dysosmobacter sp.]MDY5612239.1 DUF2508 family protein [Dysosmobacter sp.]
MRTSFSKKQRPDPELLALRAELQEAQDQLALAYRQFNQAVDPELVESCVYQISADKARCNYLIRAIKARSPEADACGIPAVNQRGGNQRYGGCGDEEDDAVWT